MNTTHRAAAKKSLSILFAIFAMQVLPVVARADEPYYAVTFADQKRWTSEVLGTAIGDVSNRHVVIGGATYGIGYYVLDNLAILTDVSGYGFNQGHDSGAAVNWTLGLRHHLLEIGKSSLFFDVSGGLLTASSAVPHHGTHFNETFEVGPGVAIPIQSDVYFIGGVRYFHLSNANREGDDHNPSVNAIQGVAGVMWRF